MDEDKKVSLWRKPLTKRQVVFWICAVVGVIVLLSTIGGQNNTSPSAGEVVTQTSPQTPADIVCGMTPQDLKTKATAVSYGQLVKDPGSFQGTFAKFTGQILQIEQSGNAGIMRLSVTDEGYGIWSPSDVVYVEYNKASTAVQGDVVTVYGMLNGTQTYTSQANYQITVPDMVACAIGAIPASASSAPAKQTSSAAATAPTPVAPTQSTTLTPTPTPTYVTPSGAVVNANGTTESAPATWHNVATFSGSGNTNTNTFTIQGSKWRADWSITPAASAESYCQQYSCSVNFQIFQDDGTYVDQFMGTGNQATSGTSYEYGKTGTFYFGVAQGNASWTVSVEDYY